MPRPFTTRERDAIRARLLEAGRSAIAVGGLRRTPIDTLARSAGISKGAYYQFFDSKEALAIAVLHEAEAELRDALYAVLDDPEPLRQVLTLIFTAVGTHPMLALLADPEEFAWLTRAVGPERLADARANDDWFFAGLAAQLQDRRAMSPEVDPRVFAGLPAAALALAQHRALIGDDRADAVIATVVDGLVRELGP